MTITRTTPFDALPEMLTVPEAARWLGLARTTAYTLVARGDISSVRFGKLLRVPRAALMARITIDETRRSVA